MANFWTQFFQGYVRVQIKGKHPERFINRCLQEKIAIWHITQTKKDTLYCSMAYQDIVHIQPHVQHAECTLTIKKRTGFPFVMETVKQRIGFAIGLICFFSMLILLSNIVWSIEIKGASPQIENNVKKAVAEMGIKRGVFQFTLPSVELIQRDITERVEGATWIGVRQKGTAYEFEVVEQQVPKETETVKPRHLIATKKAVIHSIFVERGEAKVKQNDFVQKGDLLVSGMIGKEGEETIVPAQAVVLGEIWYKSSVSIPLETLFTTLTGNRHSTHYVSVGSMKIPIWGFKRKNYTTSKTSDHHVPIKLFHWTLPITYSRVDYFESSQFLRINTEEEAVLAAKERARFDLMKHLPKQAKILDEKVLHESVHNGKVNVQIHYQVLEDITSAQPITQGE